ncbi:phosphatidylinositol transfer protein 3-like isoform X1 [Lolium rigidum]|uniref:phosphatidylinositol transfer protein 3-like isoform X1 n=1 Tax=Lolium rigidum TaxID=89674 RepID=UPI001F5CDC26|nr:phosphatidylinositol transfer protein 3-like isoform X1 [Lolium rigidum]
MSYLLKKIRSETAQQRPSSSQEEQAKHLQVNEVRDLLGELTEEMPTFLSDTTIRRFLRARNWSTEQATKGLKETVIWRREYRPDAISWEDIAEMEDEAKRTHVADYLDKNGRSVFVSHVPMKSKVSFKDQIKHLVYLLEYFATNSANEQDDYVVWLTDFRGWSISSTPFSVTRESMHIIQNYYPGLIAVAIPFDPPRIFESFWKIVKNFIQQNMKEKVKFVYASKPESMKIMEDLFDLDTLESSFGGRSTTTSFDINKYAEKMRRADKMRGASKNAKGYN